MSTVLVLVPLVAIFGYLIYKGASSLNLAFFTQIPVPVGETGGGMANAIVGSAVMLGLASLMGIPVGIAAGVYLAEYARGTLLATAVRFTADVLNGVPSIVMGIAVYSLIVMRQQHFSGVCGRRGAGDHDGADGCADDGRDAGDGAACDSRGGAGAGRSEVADGAFGEPEDGVAGNYHGMHAGVCAGCGRDGAAAVYGVRQPVLELQAESSRLRRCRCRFTSMRSRRMTSGTGWRGRGRWC